MHAIDHFNLRSFDLNLLLAFDALIEERSVTRAAARLRIGQPAMSHALGNLRLLLGDELFVRVGQIMQPTLRAEALAARVRDVLAQTQDVLFERSAFDPATSTREFRVGFSNELELLLLPRLVARLRQVGPSICLLAKGGSRQALRTLLDEGGVDLAVGCLDEAPTWQRSTPLYEETHLCCFNPRLVPLQAPLGLDDYTAHPHALMSLKDSLAGCLEDALARAGARLNTVVAAPHLVALISMVASAPLLATLPARIVRAYAPLFKLAVSPVPLELGSFLVLLLRHARSDRDAGTAWLADLVRECSDLDWEQATNRDPPENGCTTSF